MRQDFRCVPKQILAEHNCELIFGEAMTKEVNPSLVSPLSTCLGSFRFYIVLRRTCTPKIIISLTWRTSRAGGSLDRALAHSGGRLSLSPLSLILLHAAILTVPEWQARGRGWWWRRPWWWRRYTYSWEQSQHQSQNARRDVLWLRPKTRSLHAIYRRAAPIWRLVFNILTF